MTRTQCVYLWLHTSVRFSARGTSFFKSSEVLEKTRGFLVFAFSFSSFLYEKLRTANPLQVVAS